MRLSLIFGSVLFAAVALPISACGGSDDDVNDERAGVGTGDTPPDEPADPAEPGDPGTPSGEDPPAEPPPEAPPEDCSGVLALCIEGTAWSVEACACVPGTPCGPSVCAEGEVCCNESCGICTPPDGFCTDQLCEAPAGDCATDEDCALVENHCGGCNCLALPDTADAPTCDNPVNCFAPACLNKRAACVEGSCTVVEQ